VDTVSRLEALLEPSITALGYELVLVELTGTGRNTVLRLYIDSPDGISVGDCARVSEQVSAVLDVEDPIRGEYTLEVSSPGLDRPLAKRADFERFKGETIKVRMRDAVLGRKNFTGRLLAVENDFVVVEVDKETFDLPFSGIERARLVPRF
jgi:ribosome maturation factor RimP